MLQSVVKMQLKIIVFNPILLFFTPLLYMHAVEGKFTAYKRCHSLSEEHLRATGPKTVHAEKSLYFYHPKQYKAIKAMRRELEKQLDQQLDVIPTPNTRRHGNLSMTMHSLDFKPHK